MINILILLQLMIIGILIRIIRFNFLRVKFLSF